MASYIFWPGVTISQHPGTHALVYLLGCSNVLGARVGLVGQGNQVFRPTGMLQESLYVPDTPGTGYTPG